MSSVESALVEVLRAVGPTFEQISAAGNGVYQHTDELARSSRFRRGGSPSFGLAASDDGLTIDTHSMAAIVPVLDTDLLGRQVQWLLE